MLVDRNVLASYRRPFTLAGSITCWMAMACLCLPHVATAQTAPEAAQVASLPSETEEDNFIPSYIKYRPSLLFSPEDLERYLAVIRQAEMMDGQELPPEEKLPELIALEPEEEIPDTPLSYPHYHLSSIIYNNDNSWMLRINGITITASSNDVEKSLYVTRIDNNSASFIWRPQDSRLIGQLQSIDPSTIDTEHAQSLTHRLTQHGSSLEIVENMGYIRFTLEPNQLLYSEYMAIYEGSPSAILPQPPPPEPNIVDVVENPAMLFQVPSGANPMAGFQLPGGLTPAQLMQMRAPHSTGNAANAQNQSNAAPNLQDSPVMGLLPNIPQMKDAIVTHPTMPGQQ